MLEMIRSVERWPKPVLIGLMVASAVLSAAMAIAG